jgi:hypothetical protein
MDLSDSDFDVFSLYDELSENPTLSSQTATDHLSYRPLDHNDILPDKVLKFLFVYLFYFSWES